MGNAAGAGEMALLNRDHRREIEQQMRREDRDGRWSRISKLFINAVALPNKVDPSRSWPRR